MIIKIHPHPQPIIISPDSIPSIPFPSLVPPIASLAVKISDARNCGARRTVDIGCTSRDLGQASSQRSLCRVLRGPVPWLLGNCSRLHSSPPTELAAPVSVRAGGRRPSYQTCREIRMEGEERRADPPPTRPAFVNCELPVTVSELSQRRGTRETHVRL